VAGVPTLGHTQAVPNYLTLSLSDDRDLDLITAGDGPRAVVLQHGTPSDASVWREWIDPVVERGYRFIAVSRPGYATSARHHGRTVADAATDIAEYSTTSASPSSSLQVGLVGDRTHLRPRPCFQVPAQSRPSRESGHMAHPTSTSLRAWALRTKKSLVPYSKAKPRWPNG
jgi:hypothetical protein